MNVLTAIWAFFKNLYKNDTVSCCALEVLKIVFSLVVGYSLYQLMLDFTQVPMRDYRISVENLMNINQKDQLTLNVDINYGGKTSDYFNKDKEYGVSLEINSEYEINDSARVNGSSTVVNDNFDWVDRKNILRLLPKDLNLDTVSTVYFIHTRQFEIPNPKYNPKLFDKDTTCTYTDGGEKYDKTKGYLDAFRTCLVSATRMDTIKDDNIYQFKSQSIIFCNEGGHNFTMKPAQALEFSRFNVASLSDISQSDYHICIRMPKQTAEQKVNIDFGGATEFSDMQPEPDGKTMTGFYYTDPLKIKQLCEKGLWFHAKFYQLENIQMIRLFFLTTILGIMLGLLLSSVWNLMKIGITSIINTNNK